MGIRDEEINRLVKYAAGMGVKVKFNSVKNDDSAEWTLDGSEITIFTRAQGSKTETILSLIHEIGHHVWFVHEKDRQPDLKFEQAIDRQNLFAEDKADTPPPKKLREKILACEKAGTAYWETIWKDTNIKLPKWKLFAAMEFDIWMYEVYCETGSFPKGDEWQETKKRVNAKHKDIEYE